ncbi:hydroxymethylglutaryl-CoA lyase, partial [Parageobacillus sp. SY1]
VYMLHGMDIATGIDVGRLTEAALFIQEKIGRPLSSRYLQTIST